MYSKRAQLTVFIIAGILILVLFGLVTSWYRLNVRTELSQSSEFEPLKQYVQSCLQSASETALLRMGSQGLYYNLPKHSLVIISEQYAIGKDQVPFQYQVAVYPVYINGTKTSIPDKNEVEKSYAAMTTELFTSCVGDMTHFNEQGITFKLGNASTDVNIVSTRITVKTKFPILAVTNTSTFQLDEFEYTLNYPLLKKMDLVAEFTTEQQKDPNYLSLGYLTNLAYRNNFTFETETISDNIVLFHIIFNDYKKDEPFIYSFIIIYAWDVELSNFSSIEDFIPLSAYVNYPFTYQVSTPNANSSFYDFTSLFDINRSTGRISFTPKPSDAGTHEILIKIVDKDQNIDYTSLMINVSNGNSPPSIDRIPDQVMHVGVPFTYQVTATDPEGDQFYFISNSTSNITDSCKIDSRSGIISITPSVVGYYYCTIYVIDLNTEVSNTMFYVEVKD